MAARMAATATVRAVKGRKLVASRAALSIVSNFYPIELFVFVDFFVFTIVMMCQLYVNVCIFFVIQSIQLCNRLVYPAVKIFYILTLLNLKVIITDNYVYFKKSISDKKPKNDQA